MKMKMWDVPYSLLVWRREPIFLAEVQVVAEPFLVNAMQPVWN
jgi:hypothetical protein